MAIRTQVQLAPVLLQVNIPRHRRKTDSNLKWNLLIWGYVDIIGVKHIFMNSSKR
jgi:hypothetical protein